MRSSSRSRSTAQPGLLLRHALAGDGAYTFDIDAGRIRAVFVVRNPDKLRGFLERIS
jgi:hypothetical protein